MVELPSFRRTWHFAVCASGQLFVLHALRSNVVLVETVSEDD